MTFPVRIYVKEYLPVYSKESFFWKSLCIVYDNEALGVLERMIQRTEIEYKVEEAEPLRQPQGPTSGINAIIGKWPGDETDEQIEEALRKLS